MSDAAYGQDGSEPQRKVQRVEVSCSELTSSSSGADSASSINVIFAISGPRGGIYHTASGVQALRELRHTPHVTVNDDIRRAIDDAWGVICVPAESYWISQQPHRQPDTNKCIGDAANASRGGPHRLLSSPNSDTDKRGEAARAHQLINSLTARGAVDHTMAARIPDPCRLALTFYGSRLEAVAARGYEPNRGLVVVAVDRHYGSGSKLFNVLTRSRLPCGRSPVTQLVHGEDAIATAPLARDRTDGNVVGDGIEDAGCAVRYDPDVTTTSATSLTDDALVTFIDAVPRSHERNLYIVVDENCPVDPYLDIDCALASSRSGAERSLTAGISQPAKSPATRESLPVPWSWAYDATRAAQSNTLPCLTDQLLVEVENILDTVLHYMQTQLEEKLRVGLQDCVVLTSSVQTGVPFACSPALAKQGMEVRTVQALELKLSFHVHMRLADGAVFATIAELHRFMTLLRDELDETLRRPDARPDTALQVARVVRGCVDFGVYTRWRAFRLPYNVKSPMVTAMTASSITAAATKLSATVAKDSAQPDGLLAGAQTGLTVVDAAADDLLRDELVKLGITAPDVSVGAVAGSLVCEIVLSDDKTLAARQQGLLRRLIYSFRFLLPLHADLTTITNASLRRFLADYAPRRVSGGPRMSRHGGAAHGGCAPQPSVARSETSCMGPQRRLAFADVVLDRACIQRDVRDGCCVDDGISRPARMLYAAMARTTTTATSLSNPVPHVDPVKDARRDPFALERPPRPRSVRITVTDVNLKQLLVEVFTCLSPYYGGRVGNEISAEAGGAAMGGYNQASAISATRLQVQYEEAIRAYYVYQKENKYCLRLGRFHKSTYGQLYLTYGSIKMRCYSNDCCDRCLVIPWNGFSESAGQGASVAALLSRVPGYPDFTRLTQLRALLFPPLSTEELVRRYGVRVLRVN